jgi:acetoin utilization deacetylase AcuC-like enzyme
VSGEAVFVHDPSLEDYGFGEDHPFRPVRIRMTIELCESLGLLEGYLFVTYETSRLPRGIRRRRIRCFRKRTASSPLLKALSCSL